MSAISWSSVCDATLVVATSIQMEEKIKQATAPNDELKEEPTTEPSSSSSSTALIVRVPSQEINSSTIVRPRVYTPSDLTEQRTEISHNPPESYSRMLDTYTDSLKMEKTMGRTLKHMVELSAGAYHERSAFLIRFDGFDALEKGTPYIHALSEKAFTWMPASRLAPTFIDTFQWTLDFYVPGKTALLYLQVATDGREPDIYGRVMVVSERGCIPLYVNCPICVATTQSTQWCAGCHWVSYCGTQHQKEHWKVHKHVCKLYESWTGKSYKQHPQRHGQFLVPL